jgi:hypothetical protein
MPLLVNQPCLQGMLAVFSPFIDLLFINMVINYQLQSCSWEIEHIKTDILMIKICTVCNEGLLNDRIMTKGKAGEPAFKSVSALRF